MDLNVLPVWPDYTGAGVRIAVTDDGVLLTHPDLAANMDVANSYDSITDRLGGGAGTPRPGEGDSHGTMVAGIIGAIGNNGLGVTGVAPGATMVAYRVPLGDGADADPSPLPGGNAAFLRAFDRQLAAGIDISSNSWGSDAAFSNNRADPSSVAFGVDKLGTLGRNGLGTIFVVANGNERADKADGMLNNISNNRFAIAVAALGNSGTAASYSTEGANLLVSAFGGGNSPGQRADVPGNAITSTTLPEEVKSPAPAALGDYSYNMNGTSAATPMVSGVVALMLEAAAKRGGPGLGYRDVQNILAYSARWNDPASEGWIMTGASGANGNSLHYSREYGFGLVDAHAAVRLAEVWQYRDGTAHTEANLLTVTATAAGGPVAPGTAFSTDRALRLPFTLPANMLVDRVELTLDIADPNPSTLRVSLSSPDGTFVPLVTLPGNALDTGAQGAAVPEVKAVPWPGPFVLSTPAFMGGTAAGPWTVLLSNDDDMTATFNAATLRVMGAPLPQQTNFVFTDDFAALAADNPTRTDIRPTPWNETYGPAPLPRASLNAAAVTTAVTLDTSATGMFAQIGGARASLSSGTYTQLLGGDGSDTLVGNGSGQFFYGGRGADMIDGGQTSAGFAGTSTAAYMRGRAGYSVTGAGALGGAISVQGGPDGGDSLMRVSRLQFLDGTLYAPAATDTGIGTAALYQGLLGRTPDAGGYKFWTTSGLGLDTIKASILDSAEYVGGRGLLSNAQAAEALYQNLLGRAADAGGLAFWSGALDRGLSRADAALGFSASGEFAGKPIAGLMAAVGGLGNIWNA